MVTLLLLACNPWSEVADREAPWWGPTDELAKTGVNLIGAEGIHVDNRAWLLSLPPWVFEEREQEELEALLMEAENIVPVVEGKIPEEECRGQLVSGLYNVCWRWPRPTRNSGCKGQKSSARWSWSG